MALPYQGGKLTMTALLPPAGSAGCALPGQPALTAITAALRAGGGPGDAVLALPKVNLRVGGPVGDMAAVLKRLGMGVAFGRPADFTGLSPEAGGIGFVQQAATLQVGEQGHRRLGRRRGRGPGERRAGRRALRHLRPPVPAGRVREVDRRAAVPGRGRQPRQHVTGAGAAGPRMGARPLSQAGWGRMRAVPCGPAALRKPGTLAKPLLPGKPGGTASPPPADTRWALLQSLVTSAGC